jgi:hypothetical protein
MLLLCGHWSDMTLLRNPLLLGCGPCRNAALTTVVADTVDGRIVYNHCAIDVCIVNDRRIHIEHGGVVAKYGAIPTPADKAYTEVSEPIVDAAIETD